MKFDFNKIIDAWKKISSEINNPGKYSRSIFTDCKTPISASVIYENKFKSVNFIFNKTLVNKSNFEFKETKGIKVSFENDEDDKNLLILSIYLKNSSFLDAYENLLEKIITSIYDIDNQKLCFDIISNLLINWRKCFEDEKYEGLTKEEEIGLFGELTFFNKAISKNINSSNILNYWEGPEGGLHDFKFPKFLLEIKTYSKRKNKIKINNLDQLNYKFFSNLYLGCAEIEQNLSGKTLVEIIDDIKKIFNDNNNLKISFEKKLSAYGYFEIHKKNYETKYVANSLLFYKLTNKFPTILKEDLAEGINEVSFSIDINRIKKFVSDENFIE